MAKFKENVSLSRPLKLRRRHDQTKNVRAGASDRTKEEKVRPYCLAGKKLENLNAVQK